MQCSEFEIRLCDYLDGTLDQASRRELQQHASECQLCAELLADSDAFTAFLQRVPEVEAPADLAASILYRTQSARSSLSAAARGWRRWLRPLLQPRFVMGMAMTILSFSMLSRVAGVKIGQAHAADFNPVSVWRGIDNQAHRMWDRGVKFYQNVRFIYEIMSQLRGLDTTEEPAQEEKPADSPAQGSQPPGRTRRIEPSQGPNRGK